MPKRPLIPVVIELAPGLQIDVSQTDRQTLKLLGIRYRRQRGYVYRKKKKKSCHAFSSRSDNATAMNPT
jgi:hypothetical protein